MSRATAGQAIDFADGEGDVEAMMEDQADRHGGAASSQPGPGWSITHLRPVGQPEFVHQLTKTLFAPYRVEGGSISLVGCFLEEVPFLVISGPADDERRFFDQDGQQLTDSFVQSLGIDQLEAMAGPPQSVRPSAVADLDWSNV